VFLKLFFIFLTFIFYRRVP